MTIGRNKLSTDRFGSKKLSFKSIFVDPDPYRIRRTLNCFALFLKKLMSSFEFDADLFCS